MIAVAGVAWAAFSRDTPQQDLTASGPKVPSATSPSKVLGPQVPGATKASTATTPTTVTPATSAAAPVAQPAPAKPAVTKPAVTKPAVTKPAVTPPAVAAPQRQGTVAQKAYTYRVARGDTMWELTRDVLAATGRSMSNASIAALLPRFAASNANVIGSNPDLLLPGQTLVWPAGL